MILDQIKELHRGHDCETWNLLVEDSIQKAINGTIYAEWEVRYGTKQLVSGGHEFILDEDGVIDRSQMDNDYHNGPRCVRCDDFFCEHCHHKVYTEVCSELSRS